MANIDLDRDISINGHVFKAGKGVDTSATDVVDGKATKNDYADAIKENLKAAQDAEAAAKAEAERDPLEATKLMKGVDQPNPVSEAAAPTDPVVPIKEEGKK
jgi:hypothetical protein